MGTSNTGRWIVAALLAGCAVVGTMLVLRDDDAPAPRTSSAGDDRRPDAAPELVRVAPVRRHALTAPAGPLEKGGFAVVRVTESETGAPIRGASVGVPGMDDDPRVQGVTSAAGTVRIGPLQACEWPFLAAAKGRLGRWGEVVVEEGGESPLEIALDPSAALEIRVEDAAGEGVESANVDAEPLGGGRHLYADTDAHGRTSLALPPDTMFRVIARANGFTDGEAVARAPARGAAASPLTIVVARPGRLVGVVRDKHGKPVLHAAVMVRPMHDRFAAQLTANQMLVANPSGLRGWTDGDGQFAVTGLAAGRAYRAMAVHDEFTDVPGRRSAVADGLVVTPDSPVIERDFKVLPPGRLVVHVTNADGSPATGAILGTDDDAWGDRTDASVLVVFSDAESTVFAEAPDGRTASRRVAVPGGETVEITMKLGPAPEAAGVVVDDAGNPVANARVRVHMTSMPSDQNEPTNSTTTAADGTWRVASQFAGPCTVTAAADGHVTPAPVRATVPSEGTRIVLPRTAIVAFRLVAPGGARSPRSVRVRVGRTDLFGGHGSDDGAFRLGYDPAAGDRITIVFGAKSWRLPPKPTADDLLTSFAQYAPIVRTLHPVAGEVEDLGDLPLDPPSMLQVRVRDAADHAIPGARVRLDADWSSFENYGPTSVTTDSAGAVAFPCAPAAGIVPLLVTAAGFLECHAEVSSGGGDPPTITLSRGGLAWGEVVDAAGAPVADAEVTLTDSRNVATTVRADAHGIFDERLASGRWLLSADGGSPESAQLAEGGDTHVRLVAGAR